MANQQSIDLLFISLLILFLVLVVLIMLCWVFKHFKNRNLAEMKISAGQHPLQLVIRTKPEHAQQLMDHLLDRFVFKVETGPDCEKAFTEEQGQGNEIDSTLNPNPSKPPNSDSPCGDQSQDEIHALQQQDEPQLASSSCQGAFSEEICEEDKKEEETCL